MVGTSNQSVPEMAIERYVKQMMQPCIELLNPVYVNFMPAVYPQPGNCSMRSARTVGCTLSVKQNDLYC